METAGGICSSLFVLLVNAIETREALDGTYAVISVVQMATSSTAFFF